MIDLFDLGKIFDYPNTKEVRILKDMNTVSMKFEKIAIEMELFSEKKDASHFGATCALYLTRNMDDDGVLSRVAGSHDDIVEVIAMLCHELYSKTSEMNDEKAKVDILLSYGFIQDVEYEVVEGDVEDESLY